MTDFDYLAVGEKNFRKFTQTIKILFVDKRSNYDLLVGTGNSGIVMVKFVEMILDQLNIKMPPTLTIPILRFTDSDEKSKFNNEVLLDEVKKQLHNLKKIENILFVDDEIYRGISVKAAIQLVMKATRINHLNVTIVAENQGFKWTHEIPNVDVEFYPFSKEIEGHNNSIFYMIPSIFDRPIKSIFPESQLKWHNRINILLGLPIRTMVDHIPTYSFRYTEEAQSKIKNFQILQEDFSNHLRFVIEKSLH